MPAYLSVNEYIERFGNQETTILTAEEPGSVEPDSVKVERAIDDSEELANGYIALRYDVPVATPPNVLKGMIADLARERLHVNQPTPEVTLAADRARSQLKDIGAGRLTLLLDDGATAGNRGDFGSESSNDAPPVVISNRDMADYMSLGRGGLGTACWKR